MTTLATLSYSLSVEGGGALRTLQQVQVEAGNASARIVGVGEAADEAVAGLNRMGEAAQGAGARIASAAESTTRIRATQRDFEEIERRVLRWGDTTEAAVRKIEIATRAHVATEAEARRAAEGNVELQQRLATVLESIGRARELAAQRAVAGLREEVQAAALAAQGYDSLARAASRAAEQRAAPGRAAAQAQFNETLGVRGPATDEGYARRAADIEAYSRQLDALQARYAPLAAAQVAYRRELEQVAEAQRRGAIGIADMYRAQDQAAAAFRDATQHIDRFGSAQGTAAVTSGRFANVLAQGGLQLQDFVVQIQAGTSGFVALAQQGSQFLSAFGTGGALAGAALAIGAFAAQVLGLGESAGKVAKETEAQFDGVRRAQEGLADAIKVVNDLYLTQEQRARAAAAASRQAAAASLEQAERGLVARGESDAEELGKVERDIEKIEKRARAAQEINERVRRSQGPGALIPQDDVAEDRRQLFALETRRSGIQADLAAYSRRLDDVRAQMRRERDAPEAGEPDARRRAQEAVEDAREEARIQAEVSTAKRRSKDEGVRLEAQLRAEAEARRLGIEGGQVEEFVRNRVAAAVGRTAEAHRQSIPALTRAANTAENYAEGLAAAAAAAEQGYAAFLRAAAAAEAHRQAANGARGSEEALAEAILRRNAAQEARSGTDRLFQLQRQAGAVQRQLEAVDASPEDRRTAEIEAKAEEATARLRGFAEALRQQGDAAQAAVNDRLAGQIEGVTAALERGNDALKVRQSLATQRQDIAILEEERTLIAVSADEREREVAALRARRQVLNQTGSRELAEEAAQVARQTAEARQQNAYLTNSWNELAEIGSRAFDRVGQAITNALVTGQLQWKDFGNVAKAVLSEIVQAVLRLAVINPILNALFGGSRGTLGGAMEAASLAGGGGGGGLFGGMFGGGGGGGSGGGLMGTLSTGSSLVSIGKGLYGYAAGSGGAYAGGYGTGALNYLFGPSSNPTGYYNIGSVGNAFRGQPIATGFGGFDAAANGTAYTGLGGQAVSYGTAAAGALGVAGGAYGIYSGIQKGGVGGGFQIAGGTAGVGLGLMTAAGYASSIPVYGWIAAAVLAILGALLPGQKPSNREGTAVLDLAQRTIEVAGQEGAKFSQQNRDLASSVAGGIQGIISRAEGMLGVQATGTYRIGVGDRDGVYVEDAVRGRATFARDEAGINSVIGTAVQRALVDATTGMQEAVRAGLQGVNFQDLNVGIQQIAALAEATNRGRPSEFQNVASRNIDFRADFDAGVQQLRWVRDVYGPAAGQVRETEFAKQRKQIDAQWEAMIDQARALGLETGVLKQRHNEAVRELFANAADAMAGYFAQAQGRTETAVYGGPTLGSQLRTFDAAARDEVRGLRAEIEALGGTAHDVTYALADLAQAHAAERQAILERNLAARTDLDTQLTSRRLRAEGRTQEAAVFEFDAALQRDMLQLIRTLTQAGAPADEIERQKQGLAYTAGLERNALLQQQAGGAAAGPDLTPRYEAMRDRLVEIEARQARARGEALGADLMQSAHQEWRDVEALRKEMAELGYTAGEVAGAVGALTAAYRDERAVLLEQADVQARATMANARARLRGATGDTLGGQLEAFDAGMEGELRDTWRTLQGLGRSWDEVKGTVDTLWAAMQAERAQMLERAEREAQDVLGGARIRSRRARGDALGADLAEMDRQAANDVRNATEQLRALGRAAWEVEDAVANLTEAHRLERQALLDRADREARAALDQVRVRGIRATGNAYGADLAGLGVQAAEEVRALREQLQALGRGAGEVEAAVADLARAHGLEREALVERNRAALQSLGAGITNRGLRADAGLAEGEAEIRRLSEVADLADLDQRAREEIRATREQLVGLGQDQSSVAQEMARLEQVQARERLAIQKRYTDAAIAEEKRRSDTAKGLLEQLAVGELGGLSPETRYFASMQSLNAARQGLKPGDTESLQEYTRVAQMVLPVAREFLGTSERYGQLVSDVAGTLRAQAPGGDVANLATLIQAQASGTDQMTEVILSTSGVTNDLLARIQSDISRLNANLSAVMSRMAQAA